MMDALKLLATMSGLVALWSAVLFWAIKWLLARFERGIDHRFDQMSGKIADLKDTQHVAERKVLELKIELAKEYVRREDWIRGWAVVDAKLDAVWAKIDDLKDRIHKAGAASKELENG